MFFKLRVQAMEAAGLARRAMMMVVVVLMVMGWQTCAVARRITVGGTYGWNQNVNYTEWSTDNQHLHVGDWLCNLFIYFYFLILHDQLFTSYKCFCSFTCIWIATWFLLEVLIYVHVRLILKHR